ncbi:hypothetical protein [Mesorhizobium sp. M4B.F.Ca.ET.214.01.1.1]|uniref:hypothetical protein n=1 Tax=Mesorhizobium sp. M4B.F.Ca.ET.214.01.1.1 TaxID=2563955 RepID=UPI0010939331|nr:hypothetical protein [Mesorhizobium sp. M4B.F.Ca.ET.214.01.1.1]TGQ33836.1 hypothetical protein EN857_22510 [Mesorhizobium sp. M4B.F.Ca.ET.214.01.1.1]
MTDILTLTKKPDGKIGLHVDFAAFEAPMQQSLRRAAVFLGYAFHTTDSAPLASVTLKSNIVFDVGVPDPVPEAERNSYQLEFRHWAIGQGLIEIDQAYNRFVGSAIDLVNSLREFVASGAITTKKPNLANTWTLHEQFYDAVGKKAARHDEESRCLRSLGNARNCLAHDSGRVTSRRFTEDASMPVRWRGRDMFQAAKSGEQRLIPRDRVFVAQPKDIGSELSVVEVRRQRVYREGEVVQFAAWELSEILFFYQDIAIKVYGQAWDYFKEVEAAQ